MCDHVTFMSKIGWKKVLVGKVLIVKSTNEGMTDLKA